MTKMSSCLRTAKLIQTCAEVMGHGSQSPLALPINPHGLHIPRRALSVSRRSLMPESFQEELSSFQQDVKAVDPKVLTTAMGGIDEPPEEPLLSTFEEGFGYFTAAAVGRSLKHYQFVRKVR